MYAEQIKMKAEIINKRIAYLYDEIQKMAEQVNGLWKNGDYHRAIMIDRMADTQKEVDISRKIMEELGLFEDLREKK